MKLVIDTNTIISGMLWEGAPARLLSVALTGNVEIFFSLPMLLELRDALRRSKFAQRLAGTGETPDTITARFRAACHEAIPARMDVPSILRDPDDIHVLACAVAVKADAIVTGDRDLLTMNAFQNIPIIDAAEALRLLSRS